MRRRSGGICFFGPLRFRKTKRRRPWFPAFRKKRERMWHPALDWRGTEKYNPRHARTKDFSSQSNRSTPTKNTLPEMPSLSQCGLGRSGRGIYVPLPNALGWQCKHYVERAPLRSHDLPELWGDTVYQPCSFGPRTRKGDALDGRTREEHHSSWRGPVSAYHYAKEEV